MNKEDIKELRKALGKTFVREFSGVKVYKHVTNLVMEISEEGNEFPCYLVGSRIEHGGKFGDAHTELLSAKTFKEFYKETSTMM